MISRQTFANLNTPTARRALLQAVGILGAIALFWCVIAFILSFFPVWTLFLVTVILSGVWLYKVGQQQRRDAWIDAGCCAQCGYDLRGTPDSCPECGRDASLDEPMWKKVRRNFPIRGAVEPVREVLELPVTAVIEQQRPARLPNVVLHRPKVDDEPIPLEPLAGDNGINEPGKERAPEVSD